MRILDLGCGTGSDFSRGVFSAHDQIVGVDIDADRLAQGRAKFPERVFLEARGERLPFPDSSFDLVVSRVALPYMHIPRALGEVCRVLRPGGGFEATLHPWRFTLKELLLCFPRPVPTIYRLYVLWNGLLFHLTGKLFPFGRRTESFQTVTGFAHALRESGLSGFSIECHDGRFTARAQKTLRALDFGEGNRGATN